MFLVLELEGVCKAVTLSDSSDLIALQELVSSTFGGSILPTEAICEFAGSALIHDIPCSQQVPANSTILIKRKTLHLSDISQNSTPAQWLQITASHPNILAQLKSRDPEMGQVMETRNEEALRMFLMKRAMNYSKQKYEQDRELEALHADPENEENQAKIAKLIHDEEIERARLMAMEENPEAFTSVYMLYVPVEVNDVPLRAFVDSGAQMTIMSKACAERSGIMRFLDTRYAGRAVGVGSGTILGRVHMCQMKLGDSFFTISLSILESSSIDVLFGLDTLKRYRCCIDLHLNCLTMMDGVKKECIPFLSEGEIPKRELLGGEGEDEMDLSDGGGKAASSSSSSSSSTATSSSNITQSAINSLTSMGFSEESAISALSSTNGNVEEATALLLASSS